MAVMQGLYAAEHGGLGWSWEAAFVALAFRGGPQVAKLFPQLRAKFNALPKEKQNEIIEDVAKKKRTSAEIVKERLEWLQENKPQGNPPEGAPKDTSGTPPKGSERKSEGQAPESKTFNTKEQTNEAWNEMHKAPEGTIVHVTVVDVNGNKGVIEYIKRSDNKWYQQKVEGNLNGELIEDRLMFRRTGSGDAKLAYGE